MESQSSRLEQAEDRISQLEDTMVIKEKNQRTIKQLKTCEKKQQLTDSIKRPNMRIMGIEEGEEVQAKEMRNIFNKIITENVPTLEKTMPIQVQKASEHQTDLTKIELTHDIVIKITSTETRERILKAVREEKQITYKGKPIKITADFPSDKLKARRSGTSAAQQLRDSIDKWDFIKLKSFCSTKEMVFKLKRPPSEWEKIFASYTSRTDNQNI
jgi:hypothetical protein